MEGPPMHQGLLEAALSGDVGGLTQLSGDDLAGVAAGGNTAAHIASKLGHAEFLAAILRRCPSLLYRRNSTQSTPLHCAARVAGDACVRIVLQEWRRDTQTSPASPASTTPPPGGQQPEEKTVAAEDSAGAPSDTPCENIIETKDIDEDHRKDMPRWGNKRGNTALHEAVRHRHVAVVCALLEVVPFLSAITNDAGKSPLRLACDVRAQVLVGILLRYEPESSGGSLREDDGSLVIVNQGNAATVAPKRMHARKQREDHNQASIIINKLIITSVFVATMTFAAAIALPGGYDNEGSNTTAKKIAFTVFLVSDTAAMLSSVKTIFLLVKLGVLDHGGHLQSFNSSLRLVRVAVGCLVVAFATGVYVMVAFDNVFEAILTCLFSGAVPFAIYATTWWPAL